MGESLIVQGFEAYALNYTDDDFLYLQENYVVTDGIFKDENIIFDNVIPEWQEFCQSTLEFQIPVYEPVKVQASASNNTSHP